MRMLLLPVMTHYNSAPVYILRSIKNVRRKKTVRRMDSPCIKTHITLLHYYM